MPIPDDALAAIGADERGFVSDSLVPRPPGVWSWTAPETGTLGWSALVVVEFDFQEAPMAALRSLSAEH